LVEKALRHLAPASIFYAKKQYRSFKWLFLLAPEVYQFTAFTTMLMIFLTLPPHLPRIATTQAHCHSGIQLFCACNIIVLGLYAIYAAARFFLIYRFFWDLTSENK